MLLGIFGTELSGGISLLVGSASRTPDEYISYALVASLLVGVARAWELVGERDTGLLASVAELAGRTRRPEDARASSVGRCDGSAE